MPDGVLSGILYQVLNFLFEKDILKSLPEEILTSFKFNGHVSYSKGEIYNCFEVFSRGIAMPGTQKL